MLSNNDVTRNTTAAGRKTAAVRRLSAAAVLSVAVLGATACTTQTPAATAPTKQAAAAPIAKLPVTSAPTTVASSATATVPALVPTTVAAAPATATSAAPATGSRPAASGKPAVAIEDCGIGPALTRPSALELACADNGMWAKNLNWSAWSATSATATGTLTWEVCIPSCVQSTKWDSTTARITLIDPVTEPGGKVLFTGLKMHVTGSTPPGFMRDVTFNMGPSK